jgi:hypothetical protein
MGHFFYLLNHSFIALFFILVGFFSLIMPVLPKMRAFVVQFIQEESELMLLLGVGLIVIGFSFLVSVFLRISRRYIHVSKDPNAVKVDKSIIHQYLNSYWENMFPKQEIPFRFIIKQEKIQIFADLPFMPSLEQKPFAERIQKELSDIFLRSLGYREALEVSIAFQANQNKVD